MRSRRGRPAGAVRLRDEPSQLNGEARQSGGEIFSLPQGSGAEVIPVGVQRFGMRSDASVERNFGLGRSGGQGHDLTHTKSSALGNRHAHPVNRGAPGG